MAATRRSGCVTKGQRSIFKWWFCFLKDGPLFHSCWPFNKRSGMILAKRRSSLWRLLIRLCWCDEKSAVIAKRTLHSNYYHSWSSTSCPSILYIKTDAHIAIINIIYGMIMGTWRASQERKLVSYFGSFTDSFLGQDVNLTDPDNCLVYYLCQREFKGGLKITEGWYHPNPESRWIWRQG